MIWEELNPSLIVKPLRAADSGEVLTRLGGKLVAADYTKESYVEALLLREAEYPTGLDIDGMGVAIPHTDISHVNRAGIAIAVLEQPVTFIQMGTDDEPVEVQLIFMLSVVDPNAHIDQLQRILEIIQDTAVLEQLLQAENSETIINIIKEKEQSL